MYFTDRGIEELEKRRELVMQSAVAGEIGKQHRLQRALRPRDR